MADTRNRKRTGDPEPSRMRRFAGILMHRGESAVRIGDFTEAVLQFERAAWAFESLHDPRAAAQATLELGRGLLFLNHGELLPALAGRIENLAKESVDSLPEGGLLAIRVWASILRRGEREPGPFLHLLRVLRRARRAAAPQPHVPVSGGRPVIDGMPPLFLIPPPGFSAPLAEEWTLSPDGHWFVCEIDDPSAATRIEKGRRVIDLGRLLACPACWEIETKRVIVKVSADRRGYELIAALRGEACQDQAAAS